MPTQIRGSQILDASIALIKLIITGTPDGTKFLRDDWTWATPAGGWGGSATIKSVTVSITGTRQSEFTATVTDASVTPTSKILLQHWTYASTDVNEDEVESIRSIEAKDVATGSFKIRISAIGPISWDFKFNYLLS